MRPLLFRLKDIVSESEYFFNSRNPQSVDAVLKSLKESVSEIERLNEQNRHLLSAMESLKQKNLNLELALSTEKRKKADRSKAEAELLSLAQRAKRLLGLLSYAGFYNVTNSDRTKIKQWLLELCQVFEKNGYDHKGDL